ncbi:MAG TPA: hypothetical protein PL151_10210 [Phycisphaerae bacterium]|nr:hypothetical protein [Phycisphaerae bacterium]HOJ74942.1 hypothetical protein [Phycisphaerae bacterium]HOM51503.1 hypothetical protein [Phycisphaerae bacterium]HON68081.1 hypothetical protein [Phycisphaerae bacterium]HOQ87092.1 hypothetical protein [Phycisphaerae bacterium]
MLRSYKTCTIGLFSMLLLWAGTVPVARADGSSPPSTASDHEVNAGLTEPEPAPAPPPAPAVQGQPAQPVVETGEKAGQESGGAITQAIFDAGSSKISFQALLKDGVGTPLVGPVNLEFNLYSVAIGPGLVQGPIVMPGVALTNGVADVQVPVNADSFDGKARWLGVKVNGGAEMSPRLPLTAVPYAFRVNRVASEELDDIISLGTSSTAGSLTIFRTAAGTKSVELSGSNSQISTYGSDGLEQIRLWGPSWGEIMLFDQDDNTQTVLLSAGNSGFLGVPPFSDNGGELTLYGPAGGTRAFVKGYATGGVINLYDAEQDIRLALNASQGTLTVRNNSGATKITLNGNSTDAAGEISLFDGDGTETIELLAAETAGTGGQMLLRNGTGTATIELDGHFGTTGEGWIQLRKADGTATITLDADVSGDGRITTQELQITGGSDLSEQFNIVPAGEVEAVPGMVVCIHPQRPGELVVSSKAYDRTVAGVVSGAGGVKPGMLMGQKGTAADGHAPVALTGRVYVLCDASTGAIEPGDLLTTSAVPGHAMKVTDHGKAQGAVLGKAMSSLAEGRGLVLVLVSLQ